MPAGRTVHRAVGTSGARFTALQDGAVVGFVAAQDDHTRGGSLARLRGWADLAELHVAEGHRGRPGARTWFGRFGWHRIGTSRRGWERRPG